MAKVKQVALPWMQNQHMTFMALSNERPTNKLAKLFTDPADEHARERNQRADREFAEQQWQAMSQHTVGRVLLRKAKLKAALTLFDKARTQADEQWVPANLSFAENLRFAKLTAYNARLHFFRIIATYAHSAARDEWRRPVKAASAEQRASAIKHAKGLRQGMRSGVRLHDFQANEQFEALLQKIVDELEAMASKRTKRADKDAGRRAFLGGLARALLRNCGWCSAPGLMRLAEALNVPCDERYAQRICNAAQKDWKAWAESLLSMTP